MLHHNVKLLCFHRSCPECRVKSDFVTPSKYWVDEKEDKLKLIESYKKAMRWDIICNVVFCSLSPTVSCHRPVSSIIVYSYMRVWCHSHCHPSQISFSSSTFC